MRAVVMHTTGNVRSRTAHRRDHPRHCRLHLPVRLGPYRPAGRPDSGGHEYIGVVEEISSRAGATFMSELITPS